MQLILNILVGRLESFYSQMLSITLIHPHQTCAASHKVKSSQSHDFDFSYSKNKSQVKSLTFFKVNDLTLTFFFWAESQVIDLTFRWLDLTFLPTKVSKLSLNWSNLTQISPLCSDLLKNQVYFEKKREKF